MHITYVVVGITIVGISRNLLSGNVLADLWMLLPFLLLGHAIDLIPSGVPEEGKTKSYLIYGTLLSVILSIITSLILKINFITLCLSGFIVGWFDYCLWIARDLRKKDGFIRKFFKNKNKKVYGFLKNHRKLFCKIERALNWLNLRVLHWYLLIDNGNLLAKFRQKRAVEKLGKKSYRPLSQEKMGSIGAAKEVASMLFLTIFGKIEGLIELIIMALCALAVFLFQGRFGKERAP